jgi:hypothetical protein
MPHKYMHPCFKSCNVTTKISIITTMLQHILFTAIRNSKLVTAQRGTSQLVIPHKCKHPRFKSGDVTTKNFDYICNTTYFFHNNTKFKARPNTAQLVMPHECTHLLFNLCNVVTISFVASVIQHIFFAAIWNSKLVTSLRSSSCRTNICIHVSSHVMWRQKIPFITSVIQYNTYFSPQYEI